MQTIVSNPAILQDPNGKMLFSKILEETGVISSVQLQNTKQKSPSPIPQASGGNRDEIAPLLNQRFIKPSEIDSVKWKDILKDTEWEVEVDISNEGSDRRVVQLFVPKSFVLIVMCPQKFDCILTGLYMLISH